MPDPGTDFLFSCSENGCGRVFASSRGLASHRGRVHNDRLQAERDALAARVATLETAAREVLAWEPEPGDAEWLDLTTLDRWGKDIAALRGALGGPS